MLCQKSMPSWSRIMQIDQKEHDFFFFFISLQKILTDTVDSFIIKTALNKKKKEVKL